MKSLRSALGLGIALGLVSGCHVYNEDLLGGGCPPTAVGCLPDPPSNRTEPNGGGDLEIAFALTNIDLNQQGAVSSDDTWPYTGLDLDEYDTSITNPVQGCTPARASASIPPDGENGIDNVFGQSFYPNYVGTAVPFLEEQVCCWQARGRGTIIVRMRDWNGTMNDPKVTVSMMYAVDGVDTVTGRGTANVMQTIPSAYAWDNTTEHGIVMAGSLPSIVPAPPPSWQIEYGLNPPSTGTRWYIDGASLSLGNDMDNPLLNDPNAYVVDGVVVMSIKPREPITLFLGDDVSLDQYHGRGGSVKIGMTGAHAWARLSEDFTTIVSGGLGGRMSDSDLLQNASAIGLCTTADVIRANTQMYADVTSDPGVTDTSTPCDAVSIGVSFKGLRVGALNATPAPENLCLPTACAPQKTCVPLGSDHGQCGNATTEPSCPVLGP